MLGFAILDLWISPFLLQKNHSLESPGTKKVITTSRIGGFDYVDITETDMTT